MPPVGPLCSAGITPPHRYYGPIRQALAFTELRLLGSSGYLASVGFLHGARSPSLFQPMALCACHRSLLRRAGVPQTDFGTSCCLRRFYGGSATQISNFTKPQPSVHSSLRPAHSLTLLDRALSMGFTRGDFPHRCHPSYAASTYYRFRTFTLRIHGYLQASHNYAGTGGW